MIQPNECTKQTTYDQREMHEDKFLWGISVTHHIFADMADRKFMGKCEFLCHRYEAFPLHPHQNNSE